LTIEQNFSRFFILEGVTDQLKQFGYNFFDVQFSGLPSVLDVPVGPDYVLGPDDSLAVHIWNVPDPNLNRSYIAPIERDGTMFIPQVGSIPLAGSTFGQATRLIHARLSALLKRFELHVSMARLKTMKVYVVGEVIRPGSYEISSLATASHALYAACGPAKSGSLRHIRVVRDGKTVSELDFYRFFIDGDRTHDVRLQSGDTLVVPLIGPVAAIGGPVKRQAIYELTDKTTLTELIELAGGLLPTSDRRRCQIFRVEAGRQRVVLDIDLSNLIGIGIGAGLMRSKSGMSGAANVEADLLVQDGDFIRLVSISTQIENAVSLAGAVRNPGPYEFKAGMRLRDLLTPERMPVDSYLDRAELVRTDPVTYETTVTPFSPRKLFQGVTEENMELRRLDKVMVASQVKSPRMATVSGEVSRPGTYTIEGGERLSSLLTRVGGFAPRAFPQGIVLVRESVRRSQQSELEKFVSLQKQRLVAEAAALAAGNPTPQGAMAGGMSPEQAALQMQVQALDQLVARLQPGRVVIKMESLEQLKGNVDDIALEQGDQITVPLRPQTVNVLGAVRNPTSVLHRVGLQVDEYIEQSGGMTAYGDKQGVYILRANGSTDTAYAHFKDVSVGDTIVVPEQIEPKTKALPLWSSIATILGNVMLGIAAIAVIGR
jgi:protein involved in polysaccharide export with SLBB domain